MGSTFGGLEISKRGLSTHQAALNTTGHNISNADNKHYARQRVEIESAEPIYAPAFNRASVSGQLGQGSHVASVQRIRDSFYDDQIQTAENSKSYWETRHHYLKQVENIFNEPSENTLRSLLDKFWASWQDLANFPADMAHREVVIERGQALSLRINDSYNKLYTLQTRANMEVQTNVAEINSLASKVKDLNQRIQKLEALGDNPNDLKDRRDATLEKLSEFVNIHIGRGDKDELIVFIGEQALVQGEILRKLSIEGEPSKDGLYKVTWEHNRKDLVLEKGRLYALLEMRDQAILERIHELDSYALNISDIVNEAHSDGFGLNGSTNKNFFELKPLSGQANGNLQRLVGENLNPNYDLDQDGTVDSTAIFRVTGSNVIDPEKRLGIAGTLTFFKNDAQNTPVQIDYKANESIKNIIRKINDNRVGVVAYLGHDKQLSLKGTIAENDPKTNFIIRHIEDSGDLLVGYAGILSASGEQGAFDFRKIDEIQKLRPALEDIALTPNFHPSAHISISKEIKQNVANLAAARGKDIGGTGDYNTPNGNADGSNALLIAAGLKQDQRMISYAKNPEEFYNSLIAKLGTETRTALDAVEREKENLVDLNALRQSIMGVSLDEEMSNMIQFQHAYNASARMLQTQNDILDTIINRLFV